MYDYKATVTRVIDGDTFEADVQLGFYLTARLRFRLADIDTPELYRGSDLEREHGKQAAEYVEHLMLGREVVIQTGKTGKYGRWLAAVALPDGRDLATLLREQDLAKWERYV